MTTITRKRLTVRNLTLLLPADLSLVAVSTLITFKVSTDDPWFQSHNVSLLICTLANCAIYGVYFLGFRAYRRVWQHASDKDLAALALASIAAGGTSAVLLNLWPKHPIHLVTVFYSALLTLALVTALRLPLRFHSTVYQAIVFWRLRDTGDVRMERVLIYGAGDAGATISREIERVASNKWKVVGFIDDDPAKRNLTLAGIPIIGDRSSIGPSIRKHRVDSILVSIPSLPRIRLREIVDELSPYKLPIYTVPALNRWVKESEVFSQVRKVQVEDLLGREPIPLGSMDAIYLRGQKVLITGAGGSIGQEICRQVATVGPAKLVLVGRGENSIFEIQQELVAQFPKLPIEFVIADIGDTVTMERLFRVERPSVVFHAAAHKHVPLMEGNPGAALMNNVVGTRNLALLSQKFDVATFVLISTDKAVHPTNVMGASKRVAEMYLQALSIAKDSTKFVTVRFGNVLGSRNSVVQIFSKQISAGGPVTVTDEQMQRYFMTIPEAVRLVLKAGAAGKNGKVYLLDMGEPVRIMDLAERMIRLSGFEPGKDILVKITGMRPGEKLFEELARPGVDEVVNGDNEEFFEVHCPALPLLQLESMIHQMTFLCETGHDKEVGALLKRLAWWKPEVQYPASATVSFESGV